MVNKIEDHVKHYGFVTAGVMVFAYFMMKGHILQTPINIFWLFVAIVVSDLAYHKFVEKRI